MKSKRSVTKKFMPANSKRFTNDQGQRVWLIDGKEYASVRAYYESLKKKE